MFNLAVLVSGRGSNLQSIIDKLHLKDKNIEIKCVICNKKDAFALKRAKKHGIKVYFIDERRYNDKKEYDKKIIKVITNNEIDLIILAGYMKVLTPTFVKKFKNKIVNIHPSLLPAFPGLNAQKQALDYGVKVSGCTVHFVDEGVDTGPIIKQKAVEVKSDDTEKSLAKRILNYEHQILPEVIELISKKKVVLKKDNTVRIKE
ncbi:MAG TPA: phosphoribosylglycinamide formyltransferase [Halanaerobiales bacterium]|nr:phosphoribosylglycinamide formyltransferase [Halanaerobiales bacterium]